MHFLVELWLIFTKKNKRNDILLELKDVERRKTLWKIYFGNEASVKRPALFHHTDKMAVRNIIKQLNDLKEQKDYLHNALVELNFQTPQDDSSNSSDNEKDETVSQKFGSVNSEPVTPNVAVCFLPIL